MNLLPAERNKDNNVMEIKTKSLTFSELRRELGLPLVVVKKLILMGEIGAVKVVGGTVHITENELLRVKSLVGNSWNRGYLFIRALGPGLITGASDDDPSGIGTYSSVGAQYGLALIWMAAWLLPIMIAVQEVCARIGVVTNKGLAQVIKENYSKKIVFFVVSLLIVANVANIGADLGAMAASLKMLTGINYYVAAVGFAVVIILVEVLVKYHLYVKVLKWLTISVFAYIATGIIIDPDWITILKKSIIPEIHFNSAYFFAMIAVFGTSITPYLFFWQASEEVEENKLLGKKLCSKKRMCDRISHMRTDVNTGMILANIVFFFIVLTTAQVLFANGITNIESAEQAAQALRPLAGDYAYLLFALGIIGTGLLAVPILAGSGAYALAELMTWQEGLEEKFSHAKSFYLVIIFSILLGLALNFFHINPIKALYYSAFLNGVIAVPLLVIIMLVGDNILIMGEERNPQWVRFSGWFSVVLMTIAIGVSASLLF
ncbi:MAG: natural resistance-associated macrophage protein [uncultured bacterium]|nr:MAG: natural resistance-associated macrophage protein [uncultured bacterium]